MATHVLPQIDFGINTFKADESAISGISWAVGRGRQSPSINTSEQAAKSLDQESANPVTPRKRPSRGFDQQRWSPKEDENSPDKKGQLMPPKTDKTDNPSGTRGFMLLDLPESLLMQSPQDDLYRIESPQWLDDQLDAARDHKRPWRSSPTGPPTPTHDPSFRVPIYSPGKKTPVKMALSDYLTVRRDALEQMRGENQPELEQNQIGPHLIHPALEQSSLNLEENQPKCRPEDKKWRLSKGFEKYFVERNHLIGLKDEGYFNTSEARRQTIMFNYGSRKAMEDDQADFAFEDSEERAALKFTELTKEWRTCSEMDKQRSLEKVDKIQILSQDWQNSRRTAHEKIDAGEKVMADTASDLNDPFSLDNTVGGPGRKRSPKLDTLLENSRDLLLTHKAPHASEKRQTGFDTLWSFPRAKWTSAEKKEQSSSNVNNTASPKGSDTSIIGRCHTDSLTMRKRLSFFARPSFNAKNKSEKESSSANDDALIGRHGESSSKSQDAEHSHLSADHVVSSRRRIVSDEPSVVTVDALPPAPTHRQPISATSSIKAFSSKPHMPQIDSTPSIESSSSGLSAPKQGKVGFESLKGSVYTSARWNPRQTKELVQPFFNWKKTTSETMTRKKTTEAGVNGVADDVATSANSKKSCSKSIPKARGTSMTSADKFRLCF